MGCTVCLCGRKLDTDDLEWTPPSHPCHHHDDGWKRINLSGIFKCHGHVEEVVCTCECPVMHMENIAVAANREVSRPPLTSHQSPTAILKRPCKDWWDSPLFCPAVCSLLYLYLSANLSLDDIPAIPHRLITQLCSSPCFCGACKASFSPLLWFPSPRLGSV